LRAAQCYSPRFLQDIGRSVPQFQADCIPIQICITLLSLRLIIRECNTRHFSCNMLFNRFLHSLENCIIRFFLHLNVCRYGVSFENYSAVNYVAINIFQFLVLNIYIPLNKASIISKFFFKLKKLSFSLLRSLTLVICEKEWRSV